MRTTQADSITLCLWVLIKDDIDEETSKALANAQGELEEFRKNACQRGLSQRKALLTLN